MRFRPVYLAFLLCAGMSSRVAGQQAPANQPSDPANAVPAGISGGLNSLQGLRVADVRIVTEAAQHPGWLENLLVQKPNEPLDKYKVRKSVQALYNTGLFNEIQVTHNATLKEAWSWFLMLEKISS